jgi:sulfopyruvate decarboxylase subunit beta
MTLRDAIDRLVPHLRDEVCVHCNGFLSRAGFGARDADTCFYMIGSMGLASSIGLGVALARPDRRVLVLEGDGNVLMNLGTLATIAATAPPNLLQICFDNAAHASTGAQPTISDRVALDAMARAAGYGWTERAESAAALDEMLPGFLRRQGPAFLLVKIQLGPPGPPGPRIPWPPPEMTARVRRALGVS